MRYLLLGLVLISSAFGFSPERGSGCGETRVNLKDGDHGYFSSPGYPKGYRGGVDCEYRYQGVPGTVIQATVFDLKTHNALLTDISDSLYVSLSGNWNDSQRFSGDLAPVTPMVLVSEGNALAIRFRSSRFSEGNRGFRIGYFVRQSSTGKPAVTEPAHDVFVVTMCNYFPLDHPQTFPENGVSRNVVEGYNRTNPNPFLVALILDDNQFCSGTLISDRHVVTSSHCTRGVNKIDMIFGTDNLMSDDNGVQKRTAPGSAVTQHPNFDPYSGENDMSVITLEKPVEVTGFVIPAALPTWSLMGTTFTGFKGDIVGWGDSKSGTVYSQAGRKSLNVSPNAACSVTNRGHTGLSLCTRMSPGSTCQADSGSPIIASRATCNGNNYQNNNGDGGTNNLAQRPTKPQKPVKPGKPNRPSKPNNKPNRPHRPDPEDDDDRRRDDLEPLSSSSLANDPTKYKTNILFGLVSHGSCEKGFTFTRITSQLDFLARFITLHSDVVPYVSS